MKILITGSSGYLGSSFISKYTGFKYTSFSLLKNNIDEVVFDNVSIILHCAALVHQKKKYSYEDYFKINVSYPYELAKKGKKLGVKQFIFVSSVSVYGDNNEYIDENSLCDPISYYGISKLEAEKKILELNDDTFTISIIRPSMIYGKNAPGNIDKLIKLVKYVPLLPFNNIKNERTFVYIDNLCHIIKEVIEQKKGGVFVASDDSSLSTTILILLISKKLNKKIFLFNFCFINYILKLVMPSVYKKLFTSLVINNEITKEKLNLENPVSTENGIKFMLEGEKC